MKYRVYVQNVVSASVEVETDDGPEAAIEAAYQSHKMPGPITVGAFGGSASVDDGDWEPFEVYDEAGATVWSDGAEVPKEAVQ